MSSILRRASLPSGHTIFLPETATPARHPARRLTGPAAFSSSSEISDVQGRRAGTAAGWDPRRPLPAHRHPFAAEASSCKASAGARPSRRCPTFRTCVIGAPGGSLPRRPWSWRSWIRSEAGGTGVRHSLPISFTGPDCPLLPHSIFTDARVLDEQVHGCEREHLAVGRLEQPAHVFPPHLETSSRDTGNHVVVLALVVA